MTKKIKKLSSAIFVAYNCFLALTAAFNWFNLPLPVYRLLLALTAVQVFLYKLVEACDIHEEQDCHEVPPSQLTCTVSHVPIITLRSTFYNHQHVHDEYIDEIHKQLAHEIGKQLLEKDLIIFKEDQPYDDFIATYAEIKVVDDSYHKPEKLSNPLDYLTEEELFEPMKHFQD